MQRLVIVFLGLIIMSLNSHAWNNVGHRLAAQIAFDNMSPKSKKIITAYNRMLNTKGRKYTVIGSAVWMDTLYSAKYKNLRSLHYIDLPIVMDNVKTPILNSYNVLFAIKNSEAILKDPKQSKLDKALSFRILWHVVADLHQPMHAVSRYSKLFPDGDRGGNLVMLPKNKVARNLHSYWDRGAGVFYSRKSYSKRRFKELEAYILKKWPCDKKQVNLDPEVWAQESYDIATRFAYGTHLNYNYQRKAQEISLARISLAGCRLAAVIDDALGSVDN